MSEFHSYQAVSTRPGKCKSADLVFQHVAHSGRPCGRSAGARKQSDKETPENKQPRIGDKQAESLVNLPVSLRQRSPKPLQDTVRENILKRAGAEV